MSKANIKKVLLTSAVCASLFSHNLYAQGFLGGLLGGGDDKEKTVEEKQSEDKKKGAGIGALIGGAIGAATGDDDKDRLEKGAIGAAVGGLVGLAAGNEVAKKRGAYAQEHGEVENAIAATDSKINKIQQETASIESKINNNYAEISRLTQKTKLAQTDIKHAKGILDQIGNDLKTNNDLILDTRTQLKLVKNDIAKMEELIAAHPEDQGLVDTKNQLVARQSKLTSSLNSLNGITPELLAQRKSLSSIVAS